jgi:hypothetical protein
MKIFILLSFYRGNREVLKIGARENATKKGIETEIENTFFYRPVSGKVRKF